MSPNAPQLPWSTFINTAIFLGGLAGTLYNRIASPDYTQLVVSIKANGLVLYPNMTNTIVHTFRTKIYSQPECSKDDLWTAMLSTKVVEILLMEVHEQRSREQVFKALNRELKKRWEEKIEQVRLENGHKRGEELEERNGRREGDVGDEEGLCYGEWESVGC